MALASRAALVAVVFGFAIAPSASALWVVPPVLPGQWGFFNAMPLPDPAGGAGTAIRTGPAPSAVPGPVAGLGESLHLWSPAFGVVTLNPPDGMQLEDITSLKMDTYYESGSCGGGSPRYVFVVDTDGNGVSNGAVSVYAGPPPNFAGCPTGTWTTTDLLDGAARWDSTQLGGPFYGSQAQAQNAAGTNHEILRVLVVWDSSWLLGPSVVWVDNLEVNCFKLGEPVHIATSLLAGQGVCLPL